MSNKTTPTLSSSQHLPYIQTTPITATPLTTHSTPLNALPASLNAGFSDHSFSHIDVKHEHDVLGDTPSASNATTATSTSIESIGPPRPLSPDRESPQEVTPPPPNSAAKGKNGSTGPAEGKAKPHLCLACGRGFTTGGHLQRHQRIHTGVKAFRCPFPGCDTKTSRQDNLQQHYRTHLSPTLRRGDGSAARAAVNSAMEAAGIKSVSTRAPRRSKGSTSAVVTTPSSASAAGSVSHIPSPYQTPTSQPGPSPFIPYIFDPSQHAYPGYPLPPPQLQLMHAHPQPSATTSRVTSPVSGQQASGSGSGSGPATATATLLPTPPHHQHQFYQQAFPPYGYPAALPHQAYRHFPGLQNPYAPPHPHHPMFSPGGIPPEHAHHMYSPMPAAFPTHSREGSYSGMMTPGYSGQAQGPMANGSGYPPRTQTSTPISQGQGNDEGKNDITLSAYPRGHRPISPISNVGLHGNGNGHHDSNGNGDHDSGIGVHRSGGPRRTPPHDMISQGVVDPSNMHRSVHPGIIHPSYGYHQSPTHHINPYYGTPQSAHILTGRHHTSALSQRASISSLSDGSGGGEGSQKASNSV